MGRPRKHPPLSEKIAASGEHRLFPRSPATFDVILEDEQGAPLLILAAENLSVGGIFLQGDVPLRIGTHTLLSFQLDPQQPPIRLVGEIVRVQWVEDVDAGDATSPPREGFGVRFVEVAPALRAMIVAWEQAGTLGPVDRGTLRDIE